MITTPPTKPRSGPRPVIDPDLFVSIWDYVYTHALRYGQRRTAQDLGVSRHTLWRFLRRFQMGLAIPRAVLDSVGATAEALEVARLLIDDDKSRRKSSEPSLHIPEALEDTLQLLSATPLATIKELSKIGRIPATTLRDRVQNLESETLLLRRRAPELPRTFSLDDLWPVHSAGAWPEGLSLRREELYEDRI